MGTATQPAPNPAWALGSPVGHPYPPLVLEQNILSLERKDRGTQCLNSAKSQRLPLNSKRLDNR